MTDADLARGMAAAYDATPTVTVAGDVRLVLVGDALFIPGTRITVLADILRDLDVEKRSDPFLGECHAGCLGGADAAFAWLMRSGRRPRVIVGHSLGGGIAALLAAGLVCNHAAPQRLVTFGAMRCCVGEMVPNLLSNRIAAHYCHAGDPIPGEPPGFDHWREPTLIGTAHLDPLTNHSINTYATTLATEPDGSPAEAKDAP